MKLRRLVSPPGWSMRWIIGAVLLGLILPVILAASVIVAGYYPVGGALPDTSFWSDTGAIAVIFCAGVLVLAGAPIYAVLAWNWRPLAVALILVVAGIGGVVPAVMAAQQLRLWAFSLFAARSEVLVRAIESYVERTGAPPATIDALVPDYLPSVPRTGMAADTEYRYQSHGGECTSRSRWNLSVSVSQFIDMNRLLYCPDHDYASAQYPILSRTKVGTWVYDEVDF
jgi:hypothetical protein